jgi:hypothetical protein
MAVMGLGGLVAVLGGAAFVVNKLFTLLSKECKLMPGLTAQHLSPSGFKKPDGGAHITVED